MLPGLTSQARSQASGVATPEGEQPDRFNEIAFHDRLVKFIIVNDQVRSPYLFNT